jgi:nucleotide-binding universal stress UspA family protein
MVVAVDLSDSSDRALELARQLAPRAPASVVLVHVIDDEGLVSFLGGLTTSTEEVQSEADRATRALQKLAKPLAAAGIATSVRVVVGPLADTLIAVCRDLDAGMLVMGTTPGTDLHNVLFGSVSEQVLSELRLPVLLVPAP